MKYKELIQFDPINEVVKFDRLGDDDYRRSLVKNFVFSDTYEKIIIPELCKNLDYTASYDTFGIQIVGNYGTGKSHLMSLFSLIAENQDYLPLVQSDKARKALGNIAGKYKIIRFELGNDEELWKIVCYQIDLQLKKWDISYSILDDNSPDSYTDKLNRLAAYFEEKFPDKGLMIVIDEMLSYLKGRSGSDKINRDLAVLQALGQMSDHSKFRMVFGVQELIYNAPEFQFAANMLNKVNDRFRQIEITKQDVQFVVQQRLLRKTDEQKQVIRKHLSGFTEFFPDMHAHLDEYVNLFPVNPSFFENFQQIRIGKSQREVMKTLSRKFEDLLDTDVPTTNPGLICYDSYWDDLCSSQMQTFPDVRRVTEIMQTVSRKIDENFIKPGEKPNIPLAHRIANACAVKILQDSLDKTNGVNVENLLDDLCFLDPLCPDHDFLLDRINTVASQIVRATVGQYFEKNEKNGEYHLRISGGINYEQKIKDYVSTMTDDQKDGFFFNFLVEYLPVETEQYRREFKIYQHRLSWESHKIMLDGYIFMGNPDEKSTTAPRQIFYIYFMPVFHPDNSKRTLDADSVYIHFDKISPEMKELLQLYAAAQSLTASADTSQKVFYNTFIQKYRDELRRMFDSEFKQAVEIVYQGEIQPVAPKDLNGSKIDAISRITSKILEDYFCTELPGYPRFMLNYPITPDNSRAMLKGARQKIANPEIQNRDGEAILAGLGLIKDNALSTEGSIYALSISQKIQNKGDNSVLNRDEILYRFYENDFRSIDYKIGAEYEFLVLATMTALGEIEINYAAGNNINAANIRKIIDLPEEQFYSFTHVSRPKDINIAAARQLFISITGKDLTAQLSNGEVYQQLLLRAQQIAADAVRVEHDLANGIYLDDIEIISQGDALSIKHRLAALRGFCDQLPAYASQAKMRNLKWSADEIKRTTAVIADMERVKKTLQAVNQFREKTSYLSQAKQYMTDQAMIQRTDQALQNVKDVVSAIDNPQAQSRCITLLDETIDQYINWYIGQYKRMHINALQDNDKRKILNSNACKVCEAVSRADHDNGYFAVAEQYAIWERDIQSLTPISNAVTKDALLRQPYCGFNPKSFSGKQLPNLSDLSQRLSDIFDNIDASLHQILRDKDLLNSVDALNDSEKGLLQRFNSNAEDLAPSNAERLVEIVYKLHKGIRKIDIAADYLRKHVLNRPMTPDDAVKAFRKYIAEITSGSETDNIRIIFK